MEYILDNTLVSFIQLWCLKIFFFQGMSISYVFQKDNKLCLKRKNNDICDENTIAFLDIDIGCMQVVRIYILKENKEYKFLDSIKIGTIIDKNLKNKK